MDPAATALIDGLRYLVETFGQGAGMVAAFLYGLHRKWLLLGRELDGPNRTVERADADVREMKALLASQQGVIQQLLVERAELATRLRIREGA
jgi:hypothetical protein